MKINLIESVLNLIFPPVCGMCGKLNDKYICDYCYQYLNQYEKNQLDTYEDRDFKTHFWVYEYKNEIRERIIDYKFNDKSYIYRTFLELIMKNKFAIQYLQSFDVLIPVPIHKKRLKQRGYNQSELIAKAFCKEIPSLEYRNDILKKTKNIKPQSSLDRNQRAENIHGVYRIEQDNVDGYNFSNKRILLFDDVFTTGSTVNECAKTLKSINNMDIGIFTLVKD